MGGVDMKRHVSRAGSVGGEGRMRLMLAAIPFRSVPSLILPNLRQQFILPNLQQWKNLGNPPQVAGG